MELPIAVLRRYAELARHDRTEYLGPNHDTVSSDSMVAYRPVGVVSVITAYNYPILLAYARWAVRWPRAAPLSSRPARRRR